MKKINYLILLLISFVFIFSTINAETINKDLKINESIITNLYYRESCISDSTNVEIINTSSYCIITPKQAGTNIKVQKQYKNWNGTSDILTTWNLNISNEIYKHELSNLVDTINDGKYTQYLLKKNQESGYEIVYQNNELWIIRNPYSKDPLIWGKVKYNSEKKQLYIKESFDIDEEYQQSSLNQKISSITDFAKKIVIWSLEASPNFDKVYEKANGDWDKIYDYIDENYFKLEKTEYPDVYTPTLTNSSIDFELTFDEKINEKILAKLPEEKPEETPPPEQPKEEEKEEQKEEQKEEVKNPETNTFIGTILTIGLVISLIILVFMSKHTRNSKKESI